MAEIVGHGDAPPHRRRIVIAKPEKICKCSCRHLARTAIIFRLEKSFNARMT